MLYFSASKRNHSYEKSHENKRKKINKIIYFVFLYYNQVYFNIIVFAKTQHVLVTLNRQDNCSAICKLKIFMQQFNYLQHLHEFKLILYFSA